METLKRYALVLLCLALAITAGPGGVGWASLAPGVPRAQGAQDAGATLASHPVTVSGTDSSSVIRTLRTDSSGQLIVASVGGTSTVDTELPPAAALADSTSNPTAPAVASFPHLWDEALWHRQKGNFAATLLNVTGATTTQTSANQTNRNARMAFIIVDVTANPGGTETLSIDLQAVDTQSGAVISTIPQTQLVQGANGVFALAFGTGVTETLQLAAVHAQSLPLPYLWRIRIVHSGSGAWSYTVTKQELV